MSESVHPADRLHAAFHGFMRYYMAHINPVLHRTKYYGRTYSEHEIIVVMALSLVGPQRPSQLSRGLDIDKGTLTAVIRRLLGVGILEREDVPTDARGYLVSLTAAGHALVDHLTGQARSGFRRLFDSMDPADVEAAADGLDLIADHLRQREAATRRGPGSEDNDVTAHPE
nr:MarR family transcriptional regulator [Propionicimonas sp.]